MADERPAAACIEDASRARLGDALWPSVERLIPRAALTTITASAAAADAAGRMADESFAVLRRAGACAAPVPRELGGPGASLLECCALQRELGAADPALAIALNMHLFSVGSVVEHWLRRHDEAGELLAAIASDQLLVASAFAEPGLGGSILRSNCRVRRGDGGYIVSGVKTPCSLAARCDVVCLQFQADPADGGLLLIALIPAATPGVSVERTWDTLGMRASESDTLKLDDCFIPDTLVFHGCQPGFDADDVFAASLVWFSLATASTYVGVARGAVLELVPQLRQSRLTYLGGTRGEFPSFQGQLGELVARMLAIESGCVGLARALDDRERAPQDLLPAALALKHVAVEACTSVVGEACELAGASAFGRRGALSRLWRDVQGARFHPPTRLVTRQILGRWALGMPLRFELHEARANGMDGGVG